MTTKTKKKFKLLSKAIFLYIIFSLLFFIISGVILQNEANKLVYQLLENRFTHRESWVTRTLEKKPGKEINVNHALVKPISDLPANTLPRYVDTLMVNEQTQIETMTRKKSGYITIDDNHYKFDFFIEVAELYQFKEDIFKVIFFVFILMAIGLFIGNYILSGVIFEPFRKILKQMSQYKIASKAKTENIKTSTQEFYQLKILFESMKKRIEDDYYQLKEYTENMSHELQTPLTVIQNKIESLLSENNLSDKQLDRIKHIYNEIIHLSKLGSTLNLITKIENNEFNNIVSVDVASVVHEHIEKVEDLTAMKGLRMKTDFNDSFALNIDPGLLDILIRNLIKNAILYSPENSDINIRLQNGTLSISNQGEELEFPADTIFNRYKKGSGNNSLGLGLAIVKKICTINSLDVNYSFNNGIHLFSINSL